MRCGAKLCGCSLGLLQIVSCSGGGGSSGASARPAASVSYPPRSSLTEAVSITVRGETSGRDPIESVTVNGIPATSADGLRTYEVPVPLAVGRNLLTVSVRDVAGRTNAVAARVEVVREGPVPSGPIDVVLEDELRALVLDDVRLSLDRVDLATGARSVVSGAGVGGGPVLVQPAAFAIDPASGLAFVGDASAVVSVFLLTGLRFVVADDAGLGSGPTLGALGDLALGPAGHLHVASISSNAILDVEIATGDRVEVSGSGAGTGPLWSAPDGLAPHPSGLLVVDRAGNSLFSVDLATGDRALVSSDSQGAGPPLAGPVRVRWDDVKARALVTSSGGGALFAVDLATGDRELISGPGTGAGPLPVDARGLALFDLSPRALLLDRGGRRNVVSIDLGNGDRTPVFDPQVGSGPAFVALVDVELDAAGNRLLVLDAGRDELLEVDLGSGDRAVLSPAPADPSLSIAGVALALDEAGGRALCLLAERVTAVDLATGARAKTSGPDVGSGPLFSAPADLCFDPVLARVFVTNATPAAVYEVDPLTGARAVLSDAATGLGPPFGAEIAGTAWNAAASTILVVDSAAGRLFSVDPATGDRTIVAGPGGAVLFAGGDALDVDPAGARAWISLAHALIEIDLDSGAATERSLDGVEPGPWLELAGGLRFDAEGGTLSAASRGPQALFAVDVSQGERVIASR